MKEEPIALGVWEEMAELYAARVETKAHNAFYNWPAIRTLLPPVEGNRVLDAACGPGVFAMRYLFAKNRKPVGSPREGHLCHVG